jgi:5'-nucleotidase
VPFRIEDKLVIALASSALFDLTESHEVFLQKGVEEYRRYQRARETVVLKKGVAFPFISRLLSLNNIAENYEPVEVILLSRNDFNTGLRVMNSIEHYKLPISRAAFLRGGDPWRYINPFNAALFLSANEKDVQEAVMRQYPAGRVLACKYQDDPSDLELRIAFDFDGVIVDNEADRIVLLDGLNGFYKSENARALEACNPGPLKRLVEEIGKIQKTELARTESDKTYQPRIRVAIITARNAPGHKRFITTLRQWGIEPDEVFFLGGMDKRHILAEFRPHIFFDDTITNAESAAELGPAVHIPVAPEKQSA